MRRGFSLMEALISLFLVQILIVVIGSLLWQYARLSKQTHNDDLKFAGQNLLHSLAAEVAQSIQVLQPPSATLGSLLLLQRVDPARNAPWVTGSDRLPAPVPLPDPYTAWEPQTPADLIQVGYTVVGGQLRREVIDAGGNSTVQFSGQKLGGVSFDHQASGAVLLQLSLDLDGRLITYQHLALRVMP